MRLRWTRLALQDLRSLHEYIAEDDPQSARKMVARIKDGVSKLQKHSLMGRIGRVPDTRELVIAGTPYIVAYMVGSESVSIAAVIHSAMRWPEIITDG